MKAIELSDLRNPMQNTNWVIWIKLHLKIITTKRKYYKVWILDSISFCSVVSDLESLGEWFHFVLFFSLCSGPSLHLLSLRTCQFLFYIFPHSSQDNAWDYDPAAQVWGCRDSGGCSYYCHWGGSGKSPHFSGNARSDSTNPHTSPPTLLFSGITP